MYRRVHIRAQRTKFRSYRPSLQILEDRVLLSGSDFVSVTEHLELPNTNYTNIYRNGALVHSVTTTDGTEGLSVAVTPGNDILYAMKGAGPTAGVYRLDAAGQVTQLLAQDNVNDVAGNLPLVVTNTNPSGPGSLRDAIVTANRVPGPDSITFNIPGAGVQTISASSLPVIRDPVVIDGTTQPGYAGTPVIRLEGGFGSGSGLRIVAGNSTVRGLAIDDFNGVGIELSGQGGNVIRDNYIGVDPSGTQSAGNFGGGVSVLNSDANTLMDNVISGNGGRGILIKDSDFNVIQRNKIGTNAAGTSALGNSQAGVYLDHVSSTHIGGSAAEGNLISGNLGLSEAGVVINRGSNNFIQGNKIGTDVTGSVALGNWGDGVLLTNIATGTVIGGNTANDVGNLIAGNKADGVRIEDHSDGNLLQGNVIGKLLVPNEVDGVLIRTSSYNAIGGTVLGTGNAISQNYRNGVVVQGFAYGSMNEIRGDYIELNGGSGVVLSDGAISTTIGDTDPQGRNVISGNLGYGIAILGTTMGPCQPDDNEVQGNFIGTDEAGTGPLPNARGGIQISGSSCGNTIGGTAAGAANTIAFNGGNGVLVSGSTGDAIRQNSIHDHNSGLGIALSRNGNKLQAAPELVSAVSGSGQTSVAGSLTSTPDMTFALEFFSNAACSASGAGEGELYVGADQVTTDVFGVGVFVTTLGVEVPVGRFMTATATDPDGNTSRFSGCVQVTTPPGPAKALVPAVASTGIALPLGASAGPQSEAPALDDVFGWPVLNTKLNTESGDRPASRIAVAPRPFRALRGSKGTNGGMPWVDEIRPPLEDLRSDG
jgi:parallel beta-helix repeat protein